MITQQETLALAVVPVNLGKGKTEPWAKPDRAEAWLSRKNGGDTVRFQCPRPFTISFKDQSPFDWKERDGVEENGLYIAAGTVRDDALGEGGEEKSFPYDLTVDGQHVDPEVVVKKDPQG